MVHAGAAHPCAALRVEQPLEGYLTLRFVGQGDEPLATQEMSFSGTLANSSQPMVCSGDGRCLQPGPGLQLQVETVAWWRFNGRGLAQGMPLGRLAVGQCALQDSRLVCEAALHSPGLPPQRWSAQAELRP